MQKELTVPSILSLFETNKQQRSLFIEKICDAIHSGQVSALKVHLQIKAMEEIVKGITSLDRTKNKLNFENAKKYRNLLLEEANQHGKSFDLHNARFSVGETGTKYDYSETGDDKLIELEKSLELALEAVKERQKFLQNLPETGMSFVNEETGEVTTIYRPVKSSTTSVTVSLK